MRLDAGNVLLLLLLSGFVAGVTAPLEQGLPNPGDGTDAGPVVPKGDVGVCPAQCQVQGAVMVCHHADGLNLIQLAQCVNTMPSLSVVELRALKDMCSCSLLDYVRLTANAKVITFSPTPCGITLLKTCIPMLPDRGQKIRRRGLVAGLVMEQDDVGWRKATKRHLSWLWNKVNALYPTVARTRYRALVIKTVRSVYWKEGGVKPGGEDRILPFMVYKDGHMGPLYGGGRMGWFPVHDFQPSIQAAMRLGDTRNSHALLRRSWLLIDDSGGSKWMSVEDFKNLLREEVNPEDLDKDGIILKNTLDKPVKARIELKMEKITEKKDKEQGKDKEDEPPPVKERPREFFKETDDLDAETKTEVIQPTVEGGKAVFTFDDGVNSQRDGDTSKPNSKRLIAIVIVVCLIAALCILCIIYQLCCTADEDGKSYLRKFSENVAKIYDDHEEKKGDYGYDDYKMIDNADQTHGCGVHTPIPPDKQAEYDKVMQGKPILSSSKNILAGPGNGESWTQVNVFDIVDEQKKPGEGSTVKFAKLPKKVDSTTDKGKKGNAALGSPKKEDVFDMNFETIGSETGKKKSEGGEAEGGGDGKKNKKGSKKKKSKKDEKEGGTTSAESEKEGKPEKKKKDSKKKDKKDKDGEAGDDNKEGDGEKNKKKGSKKKKKGESGDEGDKKEEGGDKKKKDSKKKKKGEGGDDKDKKDGDKKDSKKKSKSDKGKDEGGDKKGGKGKKGKDEGGDKKGGKEKKSKEKGTKKKRGSAPLNRSHSASSRNNSSSSRQPSREPSYSSQRRRYLLSPDDLSRQLLPLFANWPPSLYQRSSTGHRSSRSASRRQGYKRRRGERESDESNLEDTTDEDSQDSEASSDTSRSSSRSSSSIYFDPLSFPAGYVPEHPSKTRTKPRSNSAAGDSAKPHHRFLSLSPDQMRRTSSQHGEENDRGAESRQRGSEAEGASPQQMAEKVSNEEADAERWRRWFQANSANLPAPKANMQKLCFGLHSDDHILGARSDARSRGQSGSPGPKEKESRKQRHDAPPPSEGPPPADGNFGGVRRSTDSESWKRWFQLDTETENKGKGTTDLIQICLGLHKESGNSTSTNSEDYHATDSGSQQDMPQTRTSTPNRRKTPSPGGLNKGSIMKKPPLAQRSSRQGQSSHYSSEAEIPLTRRDSSVGRGDMQRARTPRPFEAFNQEGGYPSRTDNNSSPVPIPRPRSRQELIRPASRTSDPKLSMEYTEKGTPSVPSRGGDSREGQPSVRFDVEGSEEELDFDKTFITLTSGSQSVLPSASEIERFVQTLESTSPKLFTELSSQFHKVEKEKKHLHKEDTNASRRDVTPQPSSHTWTQASSMQCDVSQQTSQFVFETPIFSFSKTKKRHVSKAQPPHTPFSPPELLPSPQRREERKRFEVRLTPTSMSSLSRAAVPADSSSGSSCYTKSVSTMYSDRSSSEASMAKRTRNSRKREEELSSESQPSFYSTKTTSNQTTRSSTR